MLQFSFSLDESTGQFSWIGNISPAKAASLISQYMESVIADQTKQIDQLKKGTADEKSNRST